MRNKKFLKLIALVAAASGVVILFTTLYPIISYENKAAVEYPILLNPLVEADSDKSTDQADGDAYANVDYTNPRNWFVGADYKTDQVSKVSFYNVSIPRLQIKDATVEVGGEDLAKSLIQYPGTALPGKNGNTVIFGHSILPQFYNPKNYLAIFSLLPTLKEGDEVEISYDGVNYRYQVTDLFEVLPTDLQILDQQTDDSYLTLVTCVPPGHPLKPRRLIVRAKVIRYENTGT